MLRSVAALLCTAVLLVSSLPTEKWELNSEKMIEAINNANTTWKASKTSRFHSLQHAKSLMGALVDFNVESFDKPIQFKGVKDLPVEFDARDKWGHICPSVRQIRDQSECGSCWAFAAATAISDRVCLHSYGTYNKTLSAEYLLSCCSSCGNGCHGGVPKAAWTFWVHEGLPTGGEYGDKNCCQSYSFPKCDHFNVKGKYKQCGPTQPTPTCEPVCQDGYPDDLQHDKKYGGSVYEVAAEDLMMELYYNGPVEAAFAVFADFVHYKSGVYVPTTKQMLGGHGVRILGWGVENHVPYWLIANSWNEDWGDDGYFKILRGKNVCGIESSVVAGLP